MVIITNVGDASGNLEGHFLCQRPSYAQLPDLELGPGESVAISLGGDVFLPPPGVKTIDAAVFVGNLDAAGGEMGLYLDQSFGDADSIVAYVEWGSTGHGRSETAVAGEYDFGSIEQKAYTKAGCGRNTPFDHIRIVG